MNDFFNILDDFEFEEFAPVGEPGSTGFSFSMDAEGDASAPEDVEEEIQDVGEDTDVVKSADDIEAKTADKVEKNDEYIWADATKPFSGSTSNIFFGISALTPKNNGTYRYYEVSIRDITAVAFTGSSSQTLTVNADQRTDGYALSITAAVGTAFGMKNGRVTGGKMTADGSFNLRRHVANADGTYGDAGTTVTIEGFHTEDGSDDVVFGATDDDLSYINVAEVAGGKVTVSGDTSFNFNGEAVKITGNSESATPDLVLSYDDDLALTLDISGFTAASGEVLTVKGAGGATTLLAPAVTAAISADTTDADIQIGKVAYDYRSSGNAEFKLDGTDVVGFGLAAVNDGIQVTKANDIKVYDVSDPDDTLAEVTDAKSYIVSKTASNQYTVQTFGSADVTVDGEDGASTTFNFTVSASTAKNSTFARNGISVVFEADGDIVGVKGLSNFKSENDSMTVSGAAATSDNEGIPIYATTSSSRPTDYIAVSDGKFTYTGNSETGGDPFLKVADGVTVYSTAGDTNLIVGTAGGTVYDGTGASYTYKGEGYLTVEDDEISGFTFVAKDDSVTVKNGQNLDLSYNGEDVTMPALVRTGGFDYTITLANSDVDDPQYKVSGLTAGTTIPATVAPLAQGITTTDEDDSFTFNSAGLITAIDGVDGDIVLRAGAYAITINDDTLTYNAANDITVTGDGSGLTKVSGLHSGDVVGSSDESTVFEFVTTGGTDVFTVGDNVYTVKGDTNGVLTINGNGVVGDLDEDASIAVTPTRALTVNGDALTADALDGESAVGYVKKSGETGAYVTDAAHPLFYRGTSVEDIEGWLGVDYTGRTFRESNGDELNRSSDTVTSKVVFDTVGTEGSAFNDLGKNLAVVTETAQGTKNIVLGNGGDAVVMMGEDEGGTVNITGGTGNDTIFVGGRSAEDVVVHNGSMKTVIDLSAGGVDKVHTYAAANANIVLNNYDETTMAGVVVHDPEIPNIKDLSAAIDAGLLVFEDGNITAIDRDEDAKGIDRKTRIQVNNKNANHQSMVRLFGYKDNSDTYSDDYGQLVGFTGKNGGILDASDIDEDVYLIGNMNGDHTVGSSLKATAHDDVVYAGGGDTVDAGQGSDTIVLQDSDTRDAATVVLGTSGKDVITNLNTGFNGDVIDISAMSSIGTIEFEDGLLTFTDESTKSTTTAAVNTEADFVAQTLINDGATLKAAIAKDGGTIDVTNANVPNYFVAQEGAINFSNFTGDVSIDVDSDWTTTSIGGEGATLLSGFSSLIGGAGNTLFKGGEFNEVLVAGTGESSLYGAGGKNILVGSTSADKFGSTEFFVQGINNGAQNVITNFEFVESGGANTATFDNLNLGMADGNDVVDVKANADGSVSLAVKGDESGHIEKVTIEGAAGKEMLVDRGTNSETVAQIAASVNTVDNSYVDFYYASEKNATVQIGDVTSAKVWLEAPDFSDGVEYVGDYTVIDATGSNAAVEMAGNNVANTIIGGLGNASMWGGTGNANDVMIAGSAHNEYYYEVGNGHDTIIGANEGDIIHLGMSLDQVNFDNTQINSAGVHVEFVDGGTLDINSPAEVSFSFDDGTNIKANRQSGQFE